jgi:hypothetical protein
LRLGGLIERTLVARTFSKVDSWALIISVFSIGLNPYRLEELCDKQMELPGWRFIVSICAFQIDVVNSQLSYHRLNMALELAKHNNVYEDIASKFFEVCTVSHFVLETLTFCNSILFSLLML